ncbi:MAG: polyphosphate polymerase domain-containing protein [Ignavibacteriales bacterium]|nr:polyphosphate polymerase domain-containing protein [Ignavibacteriales bacterium]
MLRREYKYLAPKEILDDLRSELEPYVQLDKYANIRPQKEYTVRSIYYDTLRLDYYHEKIEGLKNRKKIRIRGYNEMNSSNIIYLEIKRKLENYIDKHRSPLLYENLEELFYTGDIDRYIILKDSDAIDNAKRFFFHIHKNLLRPVTLVVYNREAFFSKFDSNIRITFDKNLRYHSFPTFASLYDESILKPAMPKHFVFEIKFYKGYSEHIQDIINRLGLLRLAVSKYQICIDADKQFGSAVNSRKFVFTNPVWNQQVYRKEAV